MAVKVRRQYAGGAAATTIGGSLASSGVTTFSIASASGWPVSTTIPFYVVVSPQTAAEEKMLVTLNGTTLTVVGRGVDGTTANTHSSGAAIYPVITAVDLDEANELASTYAHSGALVYQGASTFSELTIGTTDHVLKVSSGAPAWGQVNTAGIADSAITSAKIADGTIVNDDVSATAAISDTKLGTISTANKVALTALDVDGGTDIGAGLADADLLIVDQGAAGTNRKSALSRVATWLFAKVSGDATATSAGAVTIADDAVTTAKIANGAVTVAKFGTGILPITTVTAVGSLPTGTDGQVAYVNSNDSSEGLYTYNGTAWRKGPGWNAPWGVVSSTVSTSNDSFTTTEKVLLSSSTFTAVANRYYELTYYEPDIVNTGDTFSIKLRLTDASGAVQQETLVGNFLQGSAFIRAVLILGAGSKTIVATGDSTGGTTNITRSSTKFGQLIVSDIGPSGAPS